MRIFKRLILSISLGLMPGLAFAQTMCGAPTHTRFDETRAFFGDVLAACRPDGYCSAVMALGDPSQQYAYLSMLRIARPTPGAPYAVELTSVTPDSSGNLTGMHLRIGKEKRDISDQVVLAKNIANQFDFTNPTYIDTLVAKLKTARSVQWRYETKTGFHNAVFPLRGLADALAWVDCMGKPKA